MKMISLDDIIKYCDNERTAYKANNCGAACTALRRLAEFAKEYAVEAEPVGWISVRDRLPPYGERVLVVNETYEAKRLLKAAISEMPSADVQPVVRCKDCKYRKERHYEESGEEPYIKYECKFTKYSMSDEGFCSFGAKRDGDSE